MSTYPKRPKGEKYVQIEALRKTRRENLRSLAGIAGSWSELARQCAQSPSFLIQLAGPNPRRDVGEVLARGLEEALHLPPGWLDQVHR